MTVVDYWMFILVFFFVSLERGTSPPFSFFFLEERIMKEDENRKKASYFAMLCTFSSSTKP